MPDKDYFYVEAFEDTDISFKINGTLTKIPVLYYSTDVGGTWRQYTFGNNIFLREGYKCYWKGDNNFFSESSSNYINLQSVNLINIGGNIMSLLDSSCQSLTIPNDYCFSKIFQETNIYYANLLKLPAQTLTQGCYWGMFYGSVLLIPPEVLPATTLNDYSYRGMFWNCTNLVSAPKILANILSNSSCALMFNGCTSLKEAPDLPATNLAEFCYNGMFQNCSSLIKVPKILPATVLANSCYYNMFSGCSSLKLAPDLPATNLADECYSVMFMGCSSLISAPELPATILAVGCYANMFYGCSSLKLSNIRTGNYQIPFRIPTVDTGAIATNALIDMFSNTGGTFKGTPQINKKYYL